MLCITKPTTGKKHDSPLGKLSKFLFWISKIAFLLFGSREILFAKNAILTTLTVQR